jgi:hypothetical protein
VTNQSEFWRRCVFCGLEPNNKTKEHIIPTWLQKFAGGNEHPARILTPKGDVILPWKNLVLPACKSCNEHYGQLEGLVKDALTGISDGELKASDLSLLLDWMDKLRIGIWLLQLSLGKGAHNINPNYSIGSRLGNADRLIRIFRYHTDATGIGLLGTDTMSFSLHPVAMTVFIRDIVILSVSTSGCLQQRMGLIDTVNVVPWRESKALVNSPPDYSRFDPNWPTAYFRFSAPRYFEFIGFEVQAGKLGVLPFKTGILTDQNKRIESVKTDSLIRIPKYPSNFGDIKLTALIEILEIQRDLMRVYSLFDLGVKALSQVRNAVLELTGSINDVADLYDLFNPIPTYRR